MANINVEYINPLLKASVKVIQDACRMDVTIGKPSITPAAFTDDEQLILMGITGEMKGQAILDFPSAQSALCELCNMIMGNTATLYSLGGISIDITPPTLCMGNVTFSSSYAANICIPFNYEGQYFFRIFIAIKED